MKKKGKINKNPLIQVGGLSFLFPPSFYPKMILVQVTMIFWETQRTIEYFNTMDQTLYIDILSADTSKTHNSYW